MNQTLDESIAKICPRTTAGTRKHSIQNEQQSIKTRMLKSLKKKEFLIEIEQSGDLFDRKHNIPKKDRF